MFLAYIFFFLFVLLPSLHLTHFIPLLGTLITKHIFFPMLCRHMCVFLLALSQVLPLWKILEWTSSKLFLFTRICNCMGQISEVIGLLRGKVFVLFCFAFYCGSTFLKVCNNRHSLEPSVNMYLFWHPALMVTFLCNFAHLSVVKRIIVAACPPCRSAFDADLLY